MIIVVVIVIVVVIMIGGFVASKGKKVKGIKQNQNNNVPSPSVSFDRPIRKSDYNKPVKTDESNITPSSPSSPSPSSPSPPSPSSPSQPAPSAPSIKEKKFENVIQEQQSPQVQQTSVKEKQELVPYYRDIPEPLKKNE